jgi:hypothetical protein
MVAAKEQLGHLLVLVAERRWTQLSCELADLILSWPEDGPEAMRGPMLALFETALREADDQTQAELAPRFAGRSDIPLKILNLLYLAAPAPLRREILLRNALEQSETAPSSPADGALILAAARNGTRDFLAAFAVGAGVPRRIAQSVLSDTSGETLAVLCCGRGLDRATFSAIALLKGPRGLPLAVFDNVPPKAALHLVEDWRRLPGTLHAHVQAAE